MYATNTERSLYILCNITIFIQEPHTHKVLHHNPKPWISKRAPRSSLLLLHLTSRVVEEIEQTEGQDVVVVVFGDCVGMSAPARSAWSGEAQHGVER